MGPPRPCPVGPRAGAVGSMHVDGRMGPPFAVRRTEEVGHEDQEIRSLAF